MLQYDNLSKFCIREFLNKKWLCDFNGYFYVQNAMGEEKKLFMQFFVVTFLIFWVWKNLKCLLSRYFNRKLTRIWSSLF